MNIKPPKTNVQKIPKHRQKMSQLSSIRRRENTSGYESVFLNLPYPRNVVVVPKYLTKKPPITAPQPRPKP